VLLSESAPRYQTLDHCAATSVAHETQDTYRRLNGAAAKGIIVVTKDRTAVGREKTLELWRPQASMLTSGRTTESTAECRTAHPPLQRQPGEWASARSPAPIHQIAQSLVQRGDRLPPSGRRHTAADRVHQRHRRFRHPRSARASRTRERAALRTRRGNGLDCRRLRLRQPLTEYRLETNQRHPDRPSAGHICFSLATAPGNKPQPDGAHQSPPPRVGRPARAALIAATLRRFNGVAQDRVSLEPAQTKIQKPGEAAE